jgi:hypothetical protein
MEQGKVIGRWYVVVVLDERWGKEVRIHDTQYTNDVWLNEHNPKGYQFVSSYGVKEFLCGSGEKLILQGDVPSWVMNFSELYEAQVYVYQNQFLNGDIKMAEHINGGIAKNLNK